MIILSFQRRISELIAKNGYKEGITPCEAILYYGLGLTPIQAAIKYIEEYE